jgi:NitT/TauT family transport system substrate-binding protein
MGPWRRAALIVAAMAALGGPARAAEPIVGISAPGADGAPIFVAKEEGFYARHGLDVTVQLATLMPNMPPMIASGSAQFGVLTPTTVIQAVDGGLDMVAFSGGSVVSHKLSNQMLVARADAGIKTAADFVGRRVGVPGFGANLHVTLLYWFAAKGVDPKKINFVEVAFPAMRDLLVAKQVDAVIAIDPILTQIVASHAGYVVAELVPDLPEGIPGTIYVAMRDWAAAHPVEIKSLREALAEAEDFTNANQGKARADVAVYLKMPPDLVKLVKIGPQDPVLKPEQLGWWIDVMQKNAMLSGPVDPARMILP